MFSKSPQPVFPGRLALQQRVLPTYRVPFFDLLAQACSKGMDVFAGQPGTGESIAPARSCNIARLTLTHNWHFGSIDTAYYTCWQPGLLDWLAACRPDVLIVEANPRYLRTLPAVRWMHSRGRPVLGWGLGAPSIRGPLAGLRLKERLGFLRALDGLIAYSRRGAEEYRSLGIPDGRIFMAANAASSVPRQPPPQRKEWFDTRPTVIFVGRLQARKRVDLLLRACGELPQALQPRLLIVGDGPARSELEVLASQVYPGAEFLGGLHGDELTPWLSKADLFVLPGTGGLAVQEAMAHALPVIVAEGDGTQEDLVHPAHNGWLLPPGDLSALVAAMQEALSSPQRLRQMGAESYRIVAEEVNIEQMVAVFVDAANRVTRSTH